MKMPDSEIIKLYLGGMSGIKIEREYGIKTHYTYNVLKRNNIKSRTPIESHRIVGLNDHFFDNIDSEIKAYMLGFIIADGTVLNTKQAQRILKIDLKYEDGMELFPKFYSAIGLENRKIHSYCYETSFGETNIARFIVNSNQIAESLEKYGVINNKTFHTKFPNIDKRLNSHLIRGIVDGDGCFSYSSYDSITLAICGTEELLGRINEIFIEEGILNKMLKFYVRHKDRKNKTYTLKIGGSNQVSRAIDYLYKDATIYLNRKKEVADKNEVKRVVC